MKNLLKSVILSFTFLMLIASPVFSTNASFPQCVMYDNGTIVGAYVNEDGNTAVIGFIGSFSTDPSTWTFTDLSSAITNIGVEEPILARNANGDVLILWEYSDEFSNFDIAAAMLVSGGSDTDWNIARISSDDFRGGDNSQKGAIDENGNIQVIWTSYDSGTDSFRIVGNKAVMGTSTTWDVAAPISP